MESSVTFIIRQSVDFLNFHLAIAKDAKAEVSSDSPSPERIEELWFVCGFSIQKDRATLLVAAW